MKSTDGKTQNDIEFELEGFCQELNITEDQLANLLGVTTTKLQELKDRGYRTPFEPTSWRLEALRKVLFALDVILDGEDNDKKFHIITESKILVDFCHEDYNGETTLSALIQLDPNNNYWVPLVDIAVDDYYYQLQETLEEGFLD